MTSQSPIDPRGYMGAERNRQLSPHEVQQARQLYHARQVTARQLAMQYHLSVDSVRRMLRGDTYANVGDALPRATELATELDVDDGGAFERLTGQASATPAAEPSVPAGLAPSFDEPGDPATGEEAVLEFLRTEEKRTT